MNLESPLSATHERAGASLATWFGTLLPERFTDFGDEYRMAQEAVGAVDLGYVAFAHLKGPDRVRYFNAVITNDVKSLAPGEGQVALLLNPQGHILAELECLELADRFLILSHSSVWQRTFAMLEKYIIMDDATLADVTASLTALGLAGPKTGEVVRRGCGVDLEAMRVLEHCETIFDGVPCRIVCRKFFAAPGAAIVVERSQAEALWAKLQTAARASGGGPIGFAALNALRLEAGLAWFGYDFDDSVIPHEAALENSHVSYTKGCYTGQEIVERVRSRGHVNRRRVDLAFSGKEAPAGGAPLTVDGKPAGHVTSAAYSPGLDRAIGMGYLRREHTKPGSEVDWAGGSAEVFELAGSGTRAAGTPNLQS